MSESLRVIISLDVEEEGLFSGSYERLKPTVHNVQHLTVLKQLSLEFGIPLTLLCAHSVFMDKKACLVLEDLRDNAAAEIGAHLHHWNTPPLSSGSGSGSPERTHKLNPELLRQKLKTLLSAGRDFQGEPLRSFRMGRWDLKAELLPMLAEEGIKVDSSICPLRAFNGGADHFLSPSDPYWRQTPSGRILEAPISQLAIFPALAKTWHGLWRKKPKILDSFHFFAAMSANPLWHSAQVMRQAARTHISRGGKILNLFLHSSELMPGGSPHIPDQAAAKRIVAKLQTFIGWLFKNYNCTGIRMGDLPELDSVLKWPLLLAPKDGDW